MSTPATSTVGDLVSLALFDAGIVGVGQTANAQDSNLAFTRLNWMLSQWNRKRWLVYHLVTYSIVSTGQQSYTVGPGGNIVTPVRPDRLESAFFRQIIQSTPNQIDYPLEILESREDYNKIALKQLTTFPTCIFYDSAYPLGVVYPWPILQSVIYSLFITLKETLTQFTGLSQTITLPEEYMPALQQNLAILLRDAYGLPPSQVMIMNAKASLNTIRGANAQIARLSMPRALVRPGIYNPYSDQIR